MEHGIFTAQLQQITVQVVIDRVSLALGKIQFAFQERAFRFRIVETRGRLPAGDTRKLLQKFATPHRDEFCEFRIVFGEINKRRRRREFLSLKQHRRAGPEQAKRGDRFESPVAGQVMEPNAAQGIRDLIMVLDAIDEIRRVQSVGR